MVFRFGSSNLVGRDRSHLPSSSCVTRGLLRGLDDGQSGPSFGDPFDG